MNRLSPFPNRWLARTRSRLSHGRSNGLLSGLLGWLPILAASAFVPSVIPSAVAFAQSTSASASTSTTSAPPSTLTALTLGDAVRFAARNTASARTARLQTSEAEARVKQQRAALLPQLSAAGQQGNHTFNTASFGIDFPTAPGEPPLFNPDGEVLGPVATVDYRGRIEQTILDFGALGRVRSAQALAQSSAADADAVAEQAGANAAVAYIRALRAEDTFRARTADSVLAADLLSIAQQQLQAGVGIVLDVTRAQSQLAATRAQLIASRNTRDRSHVELLRALGLPLATTITLSDSLAGINTTGLITDETAAVAEAMQRRPDLRAEDARLTAAQRALTAIRAERLPSVGFVADKGVNGKSYDHLLNTYTYGFQVSLPIFDGLRRESRGQEQTAQIREAEIRRKDLRDQTEADIRAALLDLASAREQVDATRERLRLSDQEVSQARERFKAGVAGNADVITASLSLTDARTAVIDALTNYQAARVALARAEGTVTTLP